MDNFQLAVVTALGSLRDTGTPPPYTKSQLSKALKEVSGESNWGIGQVTLGKLVDTGFLKVSGEVNNPRIWPTEDFDSTENSLSAFQIVESQLDSESQDRDTEEHSLKVSRQQYLANMGLTTPPISDQRRARAKARMKERRDIMREFIKRNPGMFKP